MPELFEETPITPEEALERIVEQGITPEYVWDCPHGSEDMQHVYFEDGDADYFHGCISVFRDGVEGSDDYDVETDNGTNYFFTRC